MPVSSEALHVLVAGGGVAGLEALLALRDLAGDRAELTLLTPEQDFVYRPMAVAAPFARGHARRHVLSDIATHLGVTLVEGRLRAVDAAHRIACTEAGDELHYDALLVAVGARSEPALRTPNTWTPESDAAVFGGLLRDLEEGHSKRVAFIVPPGASWPLPAYELALMTAWDARDSGMDDVEVTVYTPEAAPLEMFGTDASAALREDLDAAGVRVETGTYVSEEERTLVLDPGHRRLEGSRAVSLPIAAGRGIAGLAADPRGFLLCDRHGLVAGTDSVWAAGDAIAFPVKQGGLAAQEADAAAESIAALAGADVQPRPFHPVLRGVVLTDRGRAWIRRDLETEDDGGSAERHALWWPPTKIAGRYLAPYLAERDEGAHEGDAPVAPAGQPVDLDLERELPAAADALRISALRDAANTAGFSLRRAEQAGDRSVGELQREMDRFTSDERDTEDGLRRQGYLPQAAGGGPARAKR
jgi:sulfide:quinone oxidoreductase